MTQVPSCRIGGPFAAVRGRGVFDVGRRRVITRRIGAQSGPAPLAQRARTPVRLLLLGTLSGVWPQARASEDSLTRHAGSGRLRWARIV